MMVHESTLREDEPELGAALAGFVSRELRMARHSNWQRVVATAGRRSHHLELQGIRVLDLAGVGHLQTAQQQTASNRRADWGHPAAFRHRFVLIWPTAIAMAVVGLLCEGVTSSLHTVWLCSPPPPPPPSLRAACRLPPLCVFRCACSAAESSCRQACELNAIARDRGRLARSCLSNSAPSAGT